MDFGGAIFFTDYSIGPAALGRALEERGFESLWAPEHSHIPLSRASAFPQGGDLPKKYYDVMDPFVTLAAAAAATSRLRIATGVCLVVQRDPIQTAKAVASLDQVSGGRFLFGIGAGWNAEEMADHGTAFASRFRVMRERVEAMKAIWTQDEASYDGKHVSFAPMNSWPKPVQKPHPPILVAGNGRTVYDRVRDYGDAWFPNRLGDEERFAARIDKLQRLGREQGRDSVPVTLQLAPLDADELKRYEERGVTRCVWYLPPTTRDKVERSLDKYAAAKDAAGG